MAKGPPNIEAVLRTMTTEVWELTRGVAEGKVDGSTAEALLVALRRQREFLRLGKRRPKAERPRAAWDAFDEALRELRDAIHPRRRRKR